MSNTELQKTEMPLQPRKTIQVNPFRIVLFPVCHVCVYHSYSSIAYEWDCYIQCLTELEKHLLFEFIEGNLFFIGHEKVNIPA